MTFTRRFATLHDLPDILDILREEMGPENAPFPWDMARVTHEVTISINEQLCMLLEKGGEIAGICALRMNRAWYSSEWFLGDLCFFVREKHRSSRAAILLEEGARALGHMRRLSVVIGVLGTKDIDRKIKFFRRKMTLLGAIFMARFN